MDYCSFQDLLPSEARPELDAIWARTGGSDARLSLCVAGAFSTGKTSLLNALLGERILPVAMEESTTLPTFIRYGDTARFRLVAGDAVQELERGSLASAITHPPAGAQLLDIALPLSWLRGLQIIDLPGTGSTSSVRLEYGREVMRQADAVIYLIANRGAARADLEDLRTLYFLGKKVFLCVSQWDLVEEAVARGEQAPDIQAWARTIKDECGIDAPLVPVDNGGRGVSEILAFLGDAMSSLDNVRLARFKAEARPIVANLLAEHEQAIRVLGAQGEDEAREAHQALMREKEALLRERQAAYQRQKKETDAILAQWDSGSHEIERCLKGQLASLADAWQEAEGQEVFLENGKSLVRQALEDAAVLGRKLSENYGLLELAFPELGERRISLSPPPRLEIGEFLDMGRYGLLQERLEALTQMEKQLAETPPDDKEALQADIAEREMVLQNLRRQYEALSSMPIPRYEEVVEGSSSKKQIGRVLGEIGDMAIIFVAPYRAAGSKGATAVKTASKVLKTTKLGTAAKATSDVLKTTRLPDMVCDDTPGRNGGGMGRLSDPSMKQNFAFLDMVSLGYWGEKIGSLFDKPPRTQLRVDEEALAERQQAMRLLEEDIRKKALELHGLERQLKMPGEDGESIRKEIARVREEMADAKARAEEEMAREQSVKEEAFQTMLGYEKEKCRKEWLRHFEIQARFMRNLLSSTLKEWWEAYLPTVLEEKEAQVKQLLAELDEQPARRQEKEAQLRKEMDGIEAAARMLA